MFGGPPKSEEVEKVESPSNSRATLRRREEGGPTPAGGREGWTFLELVRVWKGPTQAGGRGTRTGGGGMVP